MSKKTLLLIVIVYLNAQTEGQVQNRFAGWFSSINSISIYKKLGVQFDFSLRSSDQLKNIQTILIRPGVIYRFNETVTASIGYNNVHSLTIIDTISGYPAEHQLWQQVAIRHRSFKRIITSHRPLIEERFVSKNVVQNNSIKTIDRLFTMRIRYSFRNVFPLKNKPPFIEGPYLYTAQEILLNIVNKQAVNGKLFDQFRTVTGFGFRFSPKWDLEAGYLFRNVAAVTGVHFHDHIIQVGSFLRL